MDRLSPPRLTREKARVDLWLEEIAPGDESRQWFAHSEARWEEFKQRYFAELSEKPDLVDLILGKSRRGDVTLLSGARNEKVNNAVALKEYLEKRR